MHAAMKHWAKEGARFVLVARNKASLQRIAQDLEARGAIVLDQYVTDLGQTDLHTDLLKQAEHSLGSIDLALLGHGVLGEPQVNQSDGQVAIREIHLNFLSFVSLLTPLAEMMKARKAGHILVISSVAGDRGRQSNYVYGSAKAGLTAFLQGLRNRLHPFNVRVTTIKPGLVDSPMTDHLAKTPLFACPETVGAGIHKAVLKHRDVVYLPWFWRWIMLVVKALPEALFKRLRS